MAVLENEMKLWKPDVDLGFALEKLNKSEMFEGIDLEVLLRRSDEFRLLIGKKMKKQ